MQQGSGSSEERKSGPWVSWIGFSRGDYEEMTSIKSISVSWHHRSPVMMSFLVPVISRLQSLFITDARVSSPLMPSTSLLTLNVLNPKVHSSTSTWRNVSTNPFAQILSRVSHPVLHPSWLTESAFACFPFSLCTRLASFTFFCQAAKHVDAFPFSSHNAFELIRGEIWIWMRNSIFTIESVFLKLARLLMSTALNVLWRFGIHWRIHYANPCYASIELIKAKVSLFARILLAPSGSRDFTVLAKLKFLITFCVIGRKDLEAKLS